MPIHQASIKQIRKDKKRNLQNKQAKSALRTAIKKIYTAKTFEEKQSSYKEAEKLLDKTSQKNIIHWKNVARKKSRLAVYLNKNKTEAKT
ncbi:MAG: 30S ribosomal protein S20 [bacterium]